MPGFVGVCSRELIVSEGSLDKAVNATIYSADTSAKKVYADDHLILKRSFMNFLEVGGMEAQIKDLYIWVDGEIYNTEEFRTQINKPFAEAMLYSYTQNSLPDFLTKVDGIFIAIIYDLRKHQLQIITDRYGLKPFYLSQRNNCLMLASELKCFPFMESFTFRIRKDVIDCFIKLQHFMGTATWFEGVDVTVPSTIYTYSLLTDSLTKSRYWSWGSVKSSRSSIKSAVEELSFLLDKSIKARAFGKYKVGVALSGGFDSRAILAATYRNKPVTYTFGIKESADVKIAKSIAAMAGVEHTHFDMYVDDWLRSRFSGIWKTDGMLNMYHMHYSHLMNEIPKIMDVNLSGFLGDAVIGGTYLARKGKPFLNTRITKDIARKYYGDYFEFCDTSDSFFDIDKIDPYLFYNRGRRMIGLGAEEANKTIHQRLPFMDIRLMDFSYSLPDEFRKNSRVYHQALLLQYPEFFKEIPHATSGVPISIDPSIFHVSKRLYHRLVWIAKFKLGIATSFTDVHNWIKEPLTAQFIREILNPKNALYPNYTKTNFVEAYLQPHLSGKESNAKQVMGALTMEIWLQQVINKKYLDNFPQSK